MYDFITCRVTTSTTSWLCLTFFLPSQLLQLPCGTRYIIKKIASLILVLRSKANLTYYQIFLSTTKVKNCHGLSFECFQQETKYLSLKKILDFHASTLFFIKTFCSTVFLRLMAAWISLCWSCFICIFVNSFMSFYAANSKTQTRDA